MRNAIFLVAMTFLLTGCAGGSWPDLNVVLRGSEKQTPPLKISTEPNLPVKIDLQSDKGLPVKNEALQVTFKQSITNWITIIVAAFAALFTLLSAGGAWWAAHNTKKAAKGRLFVELTREYASDDIGEGIGSLDELLTYKEVEKWQNKNNVEATEEQHQKEAMEILKRFGSKSQIKIISKVTTYFSTILQLYKSGYISREFARKICEITKITEGVEYLMELSIRANGGGNKEVEEFRNRLKEIRHIEGA